MNLETFSTHETGPQNLAEVDKYLSLLDKKVGKVEENEVVHDVEFYKELAKKLREYGIDKIKADIDKCIKDETGKGLKKTEKIVVGGMTWHRTEYTTFVPSSFVTEVNGEKIAINFCNQKSFIKNDIHDDKNLAEYDRSIFQAWHDEINGEVYVNISRCQEWYQYVMKLVELYGCSKKFDIYDVLSGVIAHEEGHKKAAKSGNRGSILEEEANNDVMMLDFLGEPTLLMSLGDVYPAIIDEQIYLRLGKPYKFLVPNSEDYEERYKRYAQALKNVLKDTGKETEFEDAQKKILDNVKTSYAEINGKKTEKFITKNGKKVRGGYYYDEKGEWKEWDYAMDLHKAFAAILTPDILQKIIAEYKRLSVVK